MPRKPKDYRTLIEHLEEIASRASAMQRDAAIAIQSVESAARLDRPRKDLARAKHSRETMADKLADLAFRLWLTERHNPALYGLEKCSMGVKVDLRGIKHHAKRRWAELHTIKLF